ncbi:hypothetical protein RK21_00111 [Pseudomonas plecoglossicida]|nr:hypothetical protein RK21_00111 [Pseudomonas plecoglossicida]
MFVAGYLDSCGSGFTREEAGTGTAHGRSGLFAGKPAPTGVLRYFFDSALGS